MTCCSLQPSHRYALWAYQKSFPFSRCRPGSASVFLPCPVLRCSSWHYFSFHCAAAHGCQLATEDVAGELACSTSCSFFGATTPTMTMTRARISISAHCACLHTNILRTCYRSLSDCLQPGLPACPLLVTLSCHTYACKLYLCAQPSAIVLILILILILIDVLILILLLVFSGPCSGALYPAWFHLPGQLSSALSGVAWRLHRLHFCQKLRHTHRHTPPSPPCSCLSNSFCSFATCQPSGSHFCAAPLHVAGVLRFCACLGLCLACRWHLMFNFNNSLCVSVCFLILFLPSFTLIFHFPLFFHFFGAHFSFFSSSFFLRSIWLSLTAK